MEKETGLATSYIAYSIGCRPKSFIFRCSEPLTKEIGRVLMTSELDYDKNITFYKNYNNALAFTLGKKVSTLNYKWKPLLVNGRVPAKI